MLFIYCRAITLKSPLKIEFKTKYLILDMNENGGFGNDEYDVMNNSCNTFTAALSKR